MQIKALTPTLPPEWGEDQTAEGEMSLATPQAALRLNSHVNTSQSPCHLGPSLSTPGAGGQVQAKHPENSRVVGGRHPTPLRARRSLWPVSVGRSGAGGNTRRLQPGAAAHLIISLVGGGALAPCDADAQAPSLAHDGECQLETEQTPCLVGPEPSVCLQHWKARQTAPLSFFLGSLRLPG